MFIPLWVLIVLGILVVGVVGFLWWMLRGVSEVASVGAGFVDAFLRR